MFYEEEVYFAIKHPWEDRAIDATSIVSEDKQVLDKRVKELEESGWVAYIVGTIGEYFGAYLIKEIS